MRRYLVVANQTLGGEHLVEKIRECLSGGPAKFHVVVPATATKDHAMWTEGEAEEVARRRLDAALLRFRDVGADVTGEVGDPSPMQAIRDALLGESYDEVILSTLPPGASRWLKQDLVHRVERNCEVTVTHVVGEAEPVPET